MASDHGTLTYLTPPRANPAQRWPYTRFTQAW
jgi:hypothetical protein